jgi:hypothetical protein
MDRASQPPTFVVGTGRCGSTLLSQMLADHEDILSLSEFFTVVGSDRAFSREFLDGSELWNLLNVPSAEAVEILQAEVIPEVQVWKARTRRTWAEVPPLLLIPLPLLTQDPESVLEELGVAVAQLPRARSATVYQWTFDWLRDRMGKRIWIERSGGSLQFVEKLMALWPHARIVHLWRDGPSCALSMHGHPYFQALVARLKTGKSPSPVNDTEVNRRLAPVPLPVFGTYWSAAMVRGLASLERMDPTRVLHASFSALTTAPDRVLRRVAEFIGVDAAPCWLRRASARVRALPARLDTIDPAVRASLERSCRPGARAIRDAGLS